MRQPTEPDLALWLWRATAGTLALVILIGLAAALWLGARPVVTSAFVRAGEWGAWTPGPGASGSEMDGRFILRADATRAGRVVYALDESRLTDFVFEVRAALLGGPDDAGYGLIVRQRGPDEFVALLIGADGYLAIGQMSGGEWRWRVPWQQWPHIRRGPAENLLRAECRADRCRFFVNGEFAFDVDGIPAEGQAGPVVWNPQAADGVAAAFWEWRLWR